MNRLLPLLVTLVSLTALAHGTAAKPASSAPAATQESCEHDAAPAADSKGAGAADGDVVLRGEKVPAAATVTLAKLLEAPDAQNGKTVVVEGTVRRACQAKGCWMELAGSSTSKAPGVRVTFKDYGFFVPLSSAGRTARVAGVVKVTDLSDEMAAHYRSEGAMVPSQGGKAREVQLVASGVELRRPASK